MNGSVSKSARYPKKNDAYILDTDKPLDARLEPVSFKSRQIESLF